MAIDMITYEFLKNYVEGSAMGENARPRGIWEQSPNDRKGPYKEGDYVTHNNIVYIWYNEQNSANNNPEPGDGENWNNYWQEIVKNGNVYTKEETYSKGETDVLIQDAILMHGTDMWDIFYPRYMIDEKIGYIEDQIGNIDAALDAILAIQESIIGGAEQ